MIRWGYAFVLALLLALMAGFLQGSTALLVSWCVVALAACALSPTMMLVGSRHLGADIMIILASLLLSFTAIADVLHLGITPVRHGIALASAGLLLLIVSLSLWHAKASSHSVIAGLGVDRNRPSWVFLMLLGFSIAFMLLLLLLRNPALAVLCVVLLLIAWAHKGFRQSLSRAGAQAVHLFTSTRTVLLGISGLLILYLLVHIGGPVLLLLPGSVRAVAATVTAIFSAGGMDGMLLAKASLAAGYALSMAGILLLIAMPAYVWYKILKLRATGSHEHLPDWRGWEIGLATAAMAAHFLLPSLSISAITDGSAAGLRIMPLAIASPGTALGAAAAIFVCCVALGMHDRARRVLMLAPILLSLVFSGTLIYWHFISSFVYYAQLFAVLLDAGMYLALPMAVLLFLLTAALFITGFMSFLYEIWRD